MSGDRHPFCLPASVSGLSTYQVPDFGRPETADPPIRLGRLDSYGVPMGDEGSTAERRCAAPGCTTTLSVYNSDYLCFAHADEVSRSRFDMRWARQAKPARYRPSTELGTLSRVASA